MKFATYPELRRRCWIADQIDGDIPVHQKRLAHLVEERNAFAES
jgi:hypothetical protein